MAHDLLGRLLGDGLLARMETVRYTQGTTGAGGSVDLVTVPTVRTRAQWGCLLPRSKAQAKPSDGIHVGWVQAIKQRRA